MKHAGLVCLVVAAALVAGSATAGPERISYPDGYSSEFLRYLDVDRPDRKIKRYFYVNRASLESAVPGAPLPSGTVLIMEDRAVEMEGDSPKRDAAGRFIATDEITNVFVMEKQPGWGAAYASEKRNGDWDYAWFAADGSLKHSDPARYEGCFSCHQSRSERDYTFTFFKYLLDRPR